MSTCWSSSSRLSAMISLAACGCPWRGRPWHDTRAVLNGVLWVLGSGAQWRERPERYPPYQTCHRRFQQWVKTGKLEEALRVL
ncbi:MAG: transposase, partial [Acidobacteriota bacterium]